MSAGKRVYYVVIGATGVVYVKHGTAFESQGGLIEPWGECWFPVVASTVEAARQKGYEEKRYRASRGRCIVCNSSPQCERHTYRE